MKAYPKDGFARLAVVYFLASLLAWGAILTNANFDQKKAEKSFTYWSVQSRIESKERSEKAAAIHNTDPDASLPYKDTQDGLEESGTKMWEARRWFIFLAEMAVAWFVVPSLAFVSGVWVYRGFKYSN